MGAHFSAVGAERIALFARFMLGTVFLLAGMAKLRTPLAFQKAVRGLTPFNELWIRRTALWFPRLEMVLGLLLFVGAWLRLLSFALAILLLALAVALARTIVIGRRITCGCFGVDLQRKAGWLSVARNVFLVVAAAFILLHPEQPLTIDAIAARGFVPLATSTDAYLMMIGATSMVVATLLASAGLPQFRLTLKGK